MLLRSGKETGSREAAPEADMPRSQDENWSTESVPSSLRTVTNNPSPRIPHGIPNPNHGCPNGHNNQDDTPFRNLDHADDHDVEDPQYPSQISPSPSESQDSNGPASRPDSSDSSTPNSQSPASHMRSNSDPRPPARDQIDPLGRYEAEEEGPWSPTAPDATNRKRNFFQASQEPGNEEAQDRHNPNNLEAGLHGDEQEKTDGSGAKDDGGPKKRRKRKGRKEQPSPKRRDNDKNDDNQQGGNSTMRLRGE